MTDQTKEILQKQLQLLSERSGDCLDEDLVRITEVMIDIVNTLESDHINTPDYEQVTEYGPVKIQEPVIDQELSMVDKIQILCRTKKISLARLEKELGFGNGALYRWDTHSPSISKVLKVAQYFDTTVGSLLSGIKA